ncbi:MAG: bifunctional diaminohydroxyphosphoribosylaminopyrimidine deaminase/5-amino-6-(5-phosphoribosylamino)uracil reductase RibD [candidate division WOR-3 bacterium]|nr:bifunctional diaminohydroxyphosphoribosylaminopyrimidine deaminase/5-amino-6-(5-phosphoribosylamino)uracil reductase RibD [candidate division WOR-3 bacterium]
MSEALALAKKGWGRTAVNPLVGAVVVKNGKIIGRGFHRKIGEAHAEVIALHEAGSRAAGATLYVNLEPCTFKGRTPPCVDTILHYKVKRVVIGMYDPNPLVYKNGARILSENNVATEVGILEKEARELNRFYTKYITTKFPYIIVKIAASRDGRISGFPEKYITGEPSRRFVHSLRSQVDAVLVGINTILADNPYLTDRFVGRKNPARVVIDPHLKIPMTANFLKEDARRIIITSEKDNIKKIKSLQDAGVEIIFFDGDYYPLRNIFESLTALNIGSVMVEGGGILFSQILGRKLYDELYIFVSQNEIGTGINFLDENRIDLTVMREITIGEDRLYVYRNN